ncbi:hypothetical protein D3C86_1733070 [compost metagenome]
METGKDPVGTVQSEKVYGLAFCQKRPVFPFLSRSLGVVGDRPGRFLGKSLELLQYQITRSVPGSAAKAAEWPDRYALVYALQAELCRTYFQK